MPGRILREFRILWLLHALVTSHLQMSFTSMVRNRAGEEDAGLKLVNPREDGSRLVVSTRQTDRPAPDDLVALAQQLTSARELVIERACDRLRGIAEQMEHLQKAAIKVLEEAKRDEELHSVACNMQKQPGRIYHLYRKKDGSSYFSLLAPEEWAKEEKMREYVASYRLEMDRSWTPMADVAKRDVQFRSLEGILRHSAFKNEFNMGMILSANDSN